jgi:hypothetical protein
MRRRRAIGLINCADSCRNVARAPGVGGDSLTLAAAPPAGGFKRRVAVPTNAQEQCQIQ